MTVCLEICAGSAGSEYSSVLFATNSMFVKLRPEFSRNGNLFVIYTEAVESPETVVIPLNARDLAGILSQLDLESVTPSMRYGR